MKIDYNNFAARASAESPFEQAFLDQYRHDTSSIAPGARYMKTHQLYLKTKGKAGWDGRARLMDKQGIFLVGLVPDLLNKAAKKNITCTVNYTGPARIPGNFHPYGVPLHPYQQDGVNTVLNNTHPVLGWNPRGIIQVATGGGKTEMAVAIYQSLPLPTIFFVHLKQLLSQTAKRFQKYGITPGVIGDGNFTIGNITIATVQTVTSLLKKGDASVHSLLKNANQVFFDEAHGIAATVAKGNTLVDISRLMENAFIRWGLTATPFMRDQYSNMLLEGVTGSVIYKINSEELIKLGYLTPPEIRMVRIPKVPCPGKWPEVYDSGIVLNSARNDIILNEVKAAPKPCLIMCTQVAHAKIIERNSQYFNIRMGYLDGQTDTNERNRQINELKIGNLDAVVCTTIFNAGVDIPELKSLVLAAGGKSKVAQLQKLGRGLRRAPNKPTVKIIDFYDVSAKVLERHSKARMQIWKDEGFKVELK